jgi:hypothetical protein
MKSAQSSNFIDSFSFLIRIEVKERTQLIANIITNKETISSINPACGNPNPFTDVRTRNEKPSKFDAVLSMCGALLFIEVLSQP